MTVMCPRDALGHDNDCEMRRQWQLVAVDGNLCQLMAVDGSLWRLMAAGSSRRSARVGKSGGLGKSIKRLSIVLKRFWRMKVNQNLERF